GYASQPHRFTGLIAKSPSPASTPLPATNAVHPPMNWQKGTMRYSTVPFWKHPTPSLSGVTQNNR
ncbi:MAG: hypothetical protein K2K29_00890, partial [Muribaculaceae bacterium]|nr:hypothetical protein [Muribaculaceae bacterium]